MTARPTPSVFRLFIKEGLTLGLFLIVFSIPFGGIGLYMAGKELQLKISGIHTMGTVTNKWISEGEDSDSYHVQYRFQTKQQESYTNDYQVSYDFFDKLITGNPIAITYAPSDPENSKIVGESWIWFYSIFAVIGLGIFAGGVYTLRNNYKRAQMKARIYQNGTETKAIILEVADTGTRVNDEPYMEIIYEFTADGTTHTGQTKSLPIRRTDEYDLEEEIDILYDPDNPEENFWIDE